MPTKNPRLTVTLQPALAAQLRRLSSLTGSSQSSLISELLDGSGPVFERLINVLEAAEAAKGAFKGGLARDIHEAQERVEEQLGLMLDIADHTQADLVEVVEKVQRRRAQSGKRERRTMESGAVLPPTRRTPLSNRGVSIADKRSKTPARSRT